MPLTWPWPSPLVRVPLWEWELTHLDRPRWNPRNAVIRNHLRAFLLRWRGRRMFPVLTQPLVHARRAAVSQDEWGGAGVFFDVVLQRGEEKGAGAASAWRPGFARP